MRALIPAGLLVAVACGQVVLARSGDLTPWKGGGFGMFSTLDHGAFRRIVVVVEAPGRSETLAMPSSLRTSEARAAQYPATWLMRRLADRIAARERRYGRPVTVIRLDVLGTSFDAATLRATERPLRTFVQGAAERRPARSAPCVRDGAAIPPDACTTQQVAAPDRVHIPG